VSGPPQEHGADLGGRLPVVANGGRRVVGKAPARIAQDVDMVRDGYRGREPVRYREPRQEEVRMVLLRRVIGDALRARRQGQHRTLREVSTAANVSLGYLSEIERGQKEASSELLAAICDALGAQLSDVLRQVSDTLAMAEEMEGVLAGMGRADAERPADSGAPAGAGRAEEPATADAVERSQPIEPSQPAERVPTARVAGARVPAGTIATGTVPEPAPMEPTHPERVAVRAIRLPKPTEPVRRITGDGEVTVSVRHDTPLRTTLRATRPRQADDRERDVVCV
jgi:transcriptional regulator with XRE-family HTH domain